MKKRFSNLFAAFLVCVMLLCLLPQRAEAAGASFSGATSLRAGNSVTVTFAVSGSNILAIDATLSYDSSTLELLGTKKLIGNNWSMEQNGSKLLLYDTKLSNPINSSTNVFSATFRVKSGVAAGATVSASVSNVYVSDGSSDTSLGSASWSATILAPLSGDATLDDLWCSNADLSFTGGTEYRITVPYSVSALDLDWTRSHSGSSVSVSGNSLSVGANTVTLTVTAEDGTTKRYYIYVTREQDPEYVPSSDATLSSLRVSVGTLSPAFDPEITEYVVYLANETKRLELSGTARDSKAQSVRQVGSSNLSSSGETLLLMRCVAEDNTVRDYRIHVIRMPEYTGVLPEITVPDPEAPAPVVPAAPSGKEPDTALEVPLAIDLPYVGEVSVWWVAGAAIFLVLLLVWLLAWAIGRRSGWKKALHQLQAQPPAEEAPAAEAESPTEAAAESAEVPVIASELPTEESGSETSVPTEEPATEDSPAEEAAEVPAPEPEAPAEPETSTEAEAPAEEVPAAEPVQETAVEGSPAEKEASAPPHSDPLETFEELGGMSLDELLEDIRNM